MWYFGFEAVGETEEGWGASEVGDCVVWDVGIVVLVLVVA